MVSVAALLSHARAHERLRATLANKRSGTQHTPNYVAAVASARLALDLRQQAQQRDPEQTDPAWAADQLSNRGQSHAEIVAFLQKYVDTP